MGPFLQGRGEVRYLAVRARLVRSCCFLYPGFRFILFV